jgi:hypothetical protein
MKFPEKWEKFALAAAALKMVKCAGAKRNLATQLPGALTSVHSSFAYGIPPL